MIRASLVMNFAWRRGHGSACPGHPREHCLAEKSRMAGTSPAMTTEGPGRLVSGDLAGCPGSVRKAIRATSTVMAGLDPGMHVLAHPRTRRSRFARRVGDAAPACPRLGYPVVMAWIAGSGPAMTVVGTGSRKGRRVRFRRRRALAVDGPAPPRRMGSFTGSPSLAPPALAGDDRGERVTPSAPAGDERQGSCHPPSSWPGLSRPSTSWPIHGRGVPGPAFGCPCLFAGDDGGWDGLAKGAAGPFSEAQGVGGGRAGATMPNGIVYWVPFPRASPSPGMTGGSGWRRRHPPGMTGGRG